MNDTQHLSWQSSGVHRLMLWFVAQADCCVTEHINVWPKSIGSRGICVWTACPRKRSTTDLMRGQVQRCTIGNYINVNLYSIALSHNASAALNAQHTAKTSASSVGDRSWRCWDLDHAGCCSVCSRRSDQPRQMPGGHTCRAVFLARPVGSKSQSLIVPSDMLHLIFGTSFLHHSEFFIRITHPPLSDLHLNTTV